jgi:hypothetical protein
MRRDWFLKLCASVVTGVAAAFIMALGLDYADDPTVAPDPPNLEISAQTGGAFGTTFHLSTNQTVSGLRVTANELQPVADARGVTLAPIQPTQFEIQSTNQVTRLVAGETRERWTVKITEMPSEHGTWSGDLVVEWTDSQYGSLLIPITVKSISKPALAIHHPAKVVIKGQQGGSEDRKVTLHETVGGSAVTGLDVVVPELYNDGQDAVLPADNVSATIPGDISPHGYPQMKVNVNLGGVSAGSYSGKLLVTSVNADDLAVDMEVKVKHTWFWPAVVLSFGLIVLFVFSIYRTKGKPRDEVRAAFQRLKGYQKQDAEFNTYFGHVMREKEDEINAAFDSDDTEKAKAALQAAKDLWRRWDKEKPKYQRYLEEVQEKLQKIKDNEDWQKWSETEYVSTLTEHLTSIKDEKVPEYADAAAMWDDKSRTYKALEIYRAAKVGLEKLRKLKEESFLEREKDDEFEKKIQGFETTLETVDGHEPEIPEDVKTEITLPAELSKFAEDLGTAETELKEADEEAIKAAQNHFSHYDEALKLCPEIEYEPVQRAIQDALNSAKTKIIGKDFAGAARRARNAWWAASHEVRLFAKARNLEDPHAAEFNKLRDSLNAFLCDRVNYGHVPGDETEASGTYRGELKPHREAVLKIVLAANPEYEFSPGSVPPVTPQDARNRLVGMLGEGARDEVPVVDPMRALDARPPEWITLRLEEVWVRLAGLRLALFQIVTLLLSFIVLYLTAWQNQYVGNDTFGTLANYRDLLLWGFGVGLTREAVIALVAGWGVPISGT